MINCPACIAYDKGEQPGSDGIYAAEWTPEFSQIYSETWEELEEAGLIVKIAPGIIDNTEVLRLTRVKLAARDCFMY